MADHPFAIFGRPSCVSANSRTKRCRDMEVEGERRRPQPGQRHRAEEPGRHAGEQNAGSGRRDGEQDGGPPRRLTRRRRVGSGSVDGRSVEAHAATASSLVIADAAHDGGRPLDQRARHGWRRRPDAAGGIAPAPARTRAAVTGSSLAVGSSARIDAFRQKRARDADPHALAAGQVVAAFADLASRPPGSRLSSSKPTRAAARVKSGAAGDVAVPADGVGQRSCRHVDVRRNPVAAICATCGKAANSATALRCPARMRSSVDLPAPLGPEIAIRPVAAGR